MQAGSRPILREGHNCWRIGKAERAALLVDGSNYFAQLDKVIRHAQKSILIVGWDFDGGIKLRPDVAESPSLGELLRALVEDRPELEVRVLVWSVGVIHAPSAPLPLLLGAPWEKHPRIQVKLDRKHPFYAAHHQKIVCVDDEVAFCGGIDLTVRRWDSCEHLADQPLRDGPDNVLYLPVHDATMIMQGEVARLVSEVARLRWRRATGETVAPVSGSADLWPRDLQPEFTDTPIGVSRTAADWKGEIGYHEGIALTFDALRAARRSIYVEAQYLTAPSVADVLAARLQEADGPEIVLIVRRQFTSFMEGLVMGTNQKRLIQRLHRADRHGRLAVFYPVAPKEDGDCPIAVHSKIIIVDDDFLRIGSSNLANRSIGLDTEIDVAIEASDEATRRAIAHVRHRLIAEHIDAKPEALEEAVAAQGSLIGVIKQLNCNNRCLREIRKMRGVSNRMVLGTRFFDPVKPFDLFAFLRHDRKRSYGD